MITEAIVLAGGLGTRLRSVVPDLPKSLAPVAGKPFLAYLLDFAKQEGVRKFIFALGYKTEQIEEFVKSYLQEGSYIFSVEEEPLGTGGAIYKACRKTSSNNVFVMNADTYYSVPLSSLSELHEQRKAACTIALKPMKAFERYGLVEIDSNQVVTGFSEKKYQDQGLINGGVYALDARSFLTRSFPESFSFEKDYLQLEYPKQNILGMISDSYFIDIGIPEDYQKVQIEAKRLTLKA